MAWTELILQSGRTAVEIALFALLPVMVIMLCLMRLLEKAGLIEWLVRRLEPGLIWFGLTGLGLLAALQMSFVSFAAPVAVLAMMELRGASQRQLAATLAMVLAMGQANVVFPLAPMGLHLGQTLALSWLGGLVAAGITWHVLTRPLHSAMTQLPAEQPTGPRPVLDVIQQAGAEAVRIALNAIPMLALALLLVALCQQAGLFAWLGQLFAPLLTPLGLDPSIVTFTLTKYLGGGMALLGVWAEMQHTGMLNTQAMNASAGWLIHSTDLPGIAVLSAAGPRTGTMWRVAVLGALAGIVVRTAGHWWLNT